MINERVRNSLFADIHAAMASGDNIKRDELLNIARSSIDERFELNLLEGMIFLSERKAAEAYLSFCAAIEIRKDEDEVHGLCAKALKLIDPIRSKKYLEEALKIHPGSATLWIEYWGSAKNEDPKIRLNNLIKRIPLVLDSNELFVILRELEKLTIHPRFVGAVEIDVDLNRITGWAYDFANEDRAVILNVKTGDQIVEISPIASEILNGENISYKISRFDWQISTINKDIEISFQDGAVLACYKLNQKRKINCLRGKPKRHKKIDVIIPVYGGLITTIRCLKSVSASLKHNNTDCEIIIIDDSSNDNKLARELQKISKEKKFTYKRNHVNVGFIRSINFGFDLHTDRDVIILNSDTVVYGDWIDRLEKIKSTNENVASITPLSNYGELMSFPEIKSYNEFYHLRTSQWMDRCLKNFNSDPIIIPSACGFCMYIAREALNSIGYFDDINYLRGYGEETDWCMRADIAGWKHYGAMNIFIAHEGSCSFGIEKIGLAHRNNKIINQKYPIAKFIHEKFIKSYNEKKTRNDLKEKIFYEILQLAKNKRLKAQINLIENFGMKYDDERICIGIRKIDSSDDIYDIHIDCVGVLDNLSMSFKGNLKKLISSIAERKHQAIEISRAAFEKISGIESHRNCFRLTPLDNRMPMVSKIDPPGDWRKICLIVDNIDDEVIGDNWVKFTKFMHKKNNQIKLVLASPSAWDYELSLNKNFIYSPPPLMVSIVDHVKLSACGLAISIENRIDKLKMSNWAPYNFAKQAQIPLLTPHIINRSRRKNSSSGYIDEIAYLMKDFLNEK